MSKHLALSYARLSGVRNDPLSPKIQIKRNHETIIKLGLSYNPNRYTDGGDVYPDDERGQHSAFKRTNLPAWDAVMERVRTDTQQIRYVVAYDMARAFRNVMAMLQHADELLTYGVNLYLTTGGMVDVATADGRRRAIDDANAAEYHSRKTSELIRGHNQSLKAEGVYIYHRGRYGVTRIQGETDERDAKWVPNDDLPNLVEFLQRYAEGKKGWNSICPEMFRTGVTWLNSANERSEPVPDTLRKLVRGIDFYRPFLDEDYPGLIDRVKEVAARRKDHQGNGRQFRSHPPPLLAGALYCHCGKRFECGSSSYQSVKSGERHHYLNYTHKNTSCTVRPRTLTVSQINAKFLSRLESITTNSDDLQARLRAYQERIKPIPIVSPPRNNDGEISKLARLYSERKISVSEFTARLEQLEQTPPPPVPVAILPLLSAERVEAVFEMLPSLAEKLRVASVLEPAQANWTVRELFHVKLWEGEITRIELVGTEGNIYL